ncbi:MAG: 50S ribosomal protein L11 methyltransferase [Hyphomicrobiaceae bacterium]|nr:50S ribosomal protein L11 methyltransferase [Hyphomicrobiaceae bacterium]
MRIEYHRTLIADEVRNEAFYRALKAVIVPGVTRLADIGAGSGILGLMAARLGAREVFFYESAEVGAVTEASIRATGLPGCHLFACHSTEMDDPPKVDVIVTETLGNYAFEEDILTTLDDARRRMLKRGGTILPRRVRQFTSPVVAARLHDELSAWRRTGERYGIDFRSAQAMSFNNAYVRGMKPGDLLPGGTRQWDEVDLTARASGKRKGSATWAITEPASIYGFAVWWEIEIADGITLSTAPDAPATHWEQLYFPVPRPMMVVSGETVELRLSSATSPEGGTNLAWQATHLAASGTVLARQTMDLDKGYLP